jgi:arylsulfatase A-like enzyme
MIELIDEQFGRIISTLEETGQKDNTIVIFMSDHGELLGDHGLIYKGCRFFESLVHVPLIISWPEKFQKGLRSNALVELVDLAPTLLEATGIEIPYFIQGLSLMLLLEGKADHHKDYVISEYNNSLAAAQSHSHGTMYFNGRYKLIVYNGEDIGELFDLESDPDEFDNLWYDPASSRLKSELLLRHFHAYLSASGAGPRVRKEKWSGKGYAPKSPSVYD